MSTLKVSVSPDRQEIKVGRVGGFSLLTHRVPHRRRPTIHPIVAPDGVGTLTEDGPSHHPWQHGLYTGFNLVNGIGFWRDRPEDGTFEPGIHGEPAVDAGGVCRWSLATRWLAPDSRPVIAERQSWSLTDYGSSFDLEVAWGLQAEVDVVIGQFMAGGLFLRMPFAPERGGQAVNSDGLVNGEAETKRARWVSLSMPIEGRTDPAGMAIMDHPTNPAHPVTWRVDNELGISPSRCIAGSWPIARGAIDSYRFLIHVFCGTTDTAAIERRWKRFAAT